jgi:mono/diheme cytochrome c family protein
MKYLYLFLLILISIFLPQCSTHHKITYNIPPSYSKEQKEKLTTELNKGKELYKINCSQCHGIFTKGEDKIPNFTNKQIDNYAARFIRRDPKNHAAAIKMSITQLNEVLEFLKFKRVDQ